MTTYCFDTDVLSVAMRPRPSMRLIRRLSQLTPYEQCTTAITLAELVYGTAKRGDAQLVDRVREVIERAQIVLPFDERAAEVYGPLRLHLEREGKRLDEAELRIASIALARDLTLVTGNVKHLSRVPGLRVENWLAS